MSLSLRAILWDLDGVLADTADLHYHAWAAALAEFGFPYSRAIFDSHFGMNNADTLAFLLGRPPAPDWLADVSARKEAAFRSAARGQVQTLPGVREWLGRFQSWGLLQAVASSAPQANIDALIDGLQLRSYFAALVSAEGLPGKPDPAVFLAAAQKLNAASAHCLVIEDSPHGLAAAHRAGMKCLAVLTTHPAARLQAADLVVDNLARLTPQALSQLQ